MSHVISSAVIVTDLACLEAAAKELGLQWRANQKTFHWYGKWMNDYDAADAAYKLGIDPKDYGKCEHALRMPGVSYEVGIMKRKDGKGYSVVWDNWSEGTQITSHIGNGAERLMVAYQKHYLKNFSEQEGMNMESTETNEEITIEMELTNE